MTVRVPATVAPVEVTDNTSVPLFCTANILVELAAILTKKFGSVAVLLRVKRIFLASAVVMAAGLELLS